MDQQLFDRTLNVFWMVIKWLFKILIYIPIFFTAFIIVWHFMKQETSSLLGLAMVLLASLILYLAVYFLKGMLIVFRSAHKLVWVIIFIICIGFTCILPVYISFEPIEKVVAGLSKTQQPNKVVAWIFSLAFGFYVYHRYDFLSNIAPRFAFPAYQVGINAGSYLLKLTQQINAGKSKEPF